MIMFDKNRLVRARVDAMAMLEALIEGAAIRRFGIKTDADRFSTMDAEIVSSLKSLALELGFTVEPIGTAETEAA